MINVNKVNISVLNSEVELGNSKLDIKISGNNIDYIVVNTIRRTIFSDIPIYAFNIFDRLATPQALLCFKIANVGSVVKSAIKLTAASTSNKLL